MTISVTSDPETDRLLSMRASSRIPLPPEIALADPRMSSDFFRMAMFYDAYGLSGHPLVRLIEDSIIDAMMSRALSRSDHLDRVSHYGAWLGNDTVRVEDLTRGGGQGRAPVTRTDGSPEGGAAARTSRRGTPPASQSRRPTDARADVAHPERASASGGCGRQ